MNKDSYVAPARHLSRVLLATVTAFFLIICFFTANAFAGVMKEYNIVINDNGREYTVTTDETQPLDILGSVGVTLGEKDRLDISDFTSGSGGVIKIDRFNTVLIDFNDSVTSYGVYADTVGEAFTEAGINARNCSVNYGPDEAVKNGMLITVDSPNMVTVQADGKKYELGTADGTVADSLDKLGITLKGEDYVVPAAQTKITDGMTIKVFRKETKTVTETQTIAYGITKVNDSSLKKGVSELEKAGENGKREVTYKVVYINGEVSEKKRISSEVIKEPVNEIRLIGTKNEVVIPSSVDSYDKFSVGQVIRGKYTHYCACEICCGKSDASTASGKKIKNGMEDPYIVACNWLPLGSVIEVNGTTYTVEDRGGSGLSKTGRIDIFDPSGHEDVIKKGTGTCSIKIIRLGR